MFYPLWKPDISSFFTPDFFFGKLGDTDPFLLGHAGPTTHGANQNLEG